MIFARQQVCGKGRRPGRGLLAQHAKPIVVCPLFSPPPPLLLLWGCPVVLPTPPLACLTPGPVVAPPACPSWLQMGASMRVTIEQADLQVQTSQPFSPASFLPWLDVAVTLRACPQPPVSGVLGATLPLCTYRGT